MRHLTRSSLLIVIAFFISFLVVVPASAKSVASVTSPHPAGVWKAFATHLSNAEKAIVPYEGSGSCPNNATGYTGSLAQYNCVEIDYDGDGHGVWTREGGANTFGFNHFATHNLWMSTVGDVILSAQYGIRQSNGRYLYGAFYVDPEGVVDQEVQVYEERGRPNDNNVKDGNELGVVTVHCLDGSGIQEQICPDWVNQSL